MQNENLIANIGVGTAENGLPNGVTIPPLNQKIPGPSAVPIAGFRLRVEGHRHPVLLADALHDVARNPHVVTAVNTLARSDLVPYSIDYSIDYYGSFSFYI